VQNTLNGTAPAVLLTEQFVNQEAFALCLSDEVIESTVPCIRQLIEVFIELKASMVTGIEETTTEKIPAYNSVTFSETQGKVNKLISIIEKPKGAYPSLFTSIGRYVIAPVIFNLIRSLKHEANKELYLTEAFNLMMTNNDVYGLCFEGKRWDTGTKSGWIETNLRLGLL
jgi:UTP--glucose-1-phosphate uridylyltransferase